MSGRICRAHAQRGVSVRRECTQSSKRARGAGRACVRAQCEHAQAGVGEHKGSARRAEPWDGSVRSQVRTKPAHRFTGCRRGRVKVWWVTGAHGGDVKN